MSRAASNRNAGRRPGKSIGKTAIVVKPERYRHPRIDLSLVDMSQAIDDLPAFVSPGQNLYDAVNDNWAYLVDRREDFVYKPSRTIIVNGEEMLVWDN